MAEVTVNPGQVIPVRVPEETSPQPPERRGSRKNMPGMRAAVVWAEILGKPKALKNRR